MKAPRDFPKNIEYIEFLELCLLQGHAEFGACEDAAVLELCERMGFGAVMDSAARQWRKRDPIGALTVGPCVETVKQALRKEK